MLFRSPSSSHSRISSSLALIFSIRRRNCASGRGEDKPKLEYLPEKFELNDKNLVFTSGKDGIFFEGIPIGNVIFEDNKIKVKLFSDPNQISFVNVILDKSSDLEAM